MAIVILENQSQFRKKDDVKIKIIRGEGWVKKDTLEYFSEIPEGEASTDYGKLTTRVRKEETGEIYEIAHDVQDANYTYTELYPTKDSYSEITFLYVSEYLAIPNFNLYPAYKANVTYSEGDIVTYNNWEWISEMNDNTGNTPNNGVGWSEYLPYIETREVKWKTLEELANE